MAEPLDLRLGLRLDAMDAGDLEGVRAAERGVEIDVRLDEDLGADGALEQDDD